MWDGDGEEGDMGLGEVGREVARGLGIDAGVLDLVQTPETGLPWRSRLPVARLATDSVGLASLTMDLAGAARGDRPPGIVQVDGPRVAASFTSERIIRMDGEPPAVWAPLSGFWRAADGWVRTHANYPHHERALRRLLHLTADADRDAVAEAISKHPAVELETTAAHTGAVVGAVRSPEAWGRDPQGEAIAATPMVEMRRVGEAPARVWRADAAEPLRGIRVLDLTRVLAGPIATRDLALAGAEVLRIDSPLLPETGWIHLDTGQNKRSALLDLAVAADRATFEGLLAGADVLVTGYRPGALGRYGLDPEDVAKRHPGVVMAQVSAWGYAGEWGSRRGFDSIVQAVTGIALTEGGDGVTPGALPAQALDHSTGHFLAAAITTALVEQRRGGGSISVRMSLARTAHALLSSQDEVAVAADVELPFAERALPGREPASLRYAPPVLSFHGAPTDYTRVGGMWGADTAAWSHEG
jgi:crotonobetainyl-CoA:carnitine CoA-transferase CaiB-like acyl-CoA transferase